LDLIGIVLFLDLPILAVFAEMVHHGMAEMTMDSYQTRRVNAEKIVILYEID